MKSKFDSPLPPHDDAAEQGVIGSIILAPQDCLSECIEKKVTANMFYRCQHSMLYAALLAMFNAQTPIDLLTIKSHLGKQGVSDCGGPKYISTLPDKTPSAVNLEYYVEKLKEKFILRSAIQNCQKIIDKAMEYKGDVGKFMDESEKKILSIRNQVEASKGITDQVECIVSLQEKYAKALEVKEFAGLKTGFKEHDAIIGGLLGPKFVILTASQSTGKTSYMQNIFCNLAREGVCSGLISLDDTAEDVVHRNLCALSGVNGHRLMMGAPNLGDFDKITSACDEAMRLKDLILIDDASGITLQQCQAKMRRMAQLGAKIIGIDFMQLLVTHETGSERMATISQGIKNTGKELGIPVIGISTLTREEMKSEKAPRIDGLFGTGQWQFDANQIWLMWVKSDDRKKELRMAHLEVGKNKTGGNGSLWLDFFAPAFKFYDHCPITQEDVARETKKQTKDD